jgi:hypothetical protein
MITKLKVKLQTSFDKYPKVAQCLLEDLDIADLSLSAPRETFTENQYVEGFISYGKGKVKFNGQIIEVIDNKNNTDYLEIKIEKMESTVGLLQFMKERQEKITNFMKRAKGL